MTEPPLLQRVIDELKLSIATDQLARQVTATPITSAQLVRVTAKDADPAVATRIANTLCGDFVDQVTQQNTQRVNQAGADYQAQIAALTNALNDEESKLANAPRNQDTTVLKAEIVSNTSLLLTVGAAYDKFRATQAQDLETVSIAAPATHPTQPDSPNVAVTLALALIAGLIVALGLVALGEILALRMAGQALSG